MPTSMEFNSFTAMANAVACKTTSAASLAPWVPNGAGRHHLHTKSGRPTTKEMEAALQATRADIQTERERLGIRVEMLGGTMDRLDLEVGRLVVEFEEHAIASAAAHCLLLTKLREASDCGA